MHILSNAKYSALTTEIEKLKSDVNRYNLNHSELSRELDIVSTELDNWRFWAAGNKEEDVAQKIELDKIKKYALVLTQENVDLESVRIDLTRKLKDLGVSVFENNSPVINEGLKEFRNKKK